MLFDRAGVARVRLRRVLHQPRRPRAQHARAVEPLGLRHLRRSADRARARRPSRRRSARAPAAARAGVLARQGPARRRRDPQRASRRLSRRDAEPARRACVQEPRWAAGRTSPAACSCCARTACPRPTAICCRRSRASCCAAISASWRRSSIGPRPWLYDEPTSLPRRSVPAAEAGRRRRCRSRRCVMENGIGGFTPDGREYVVVLEGDRETPLPWSNVLANPEFGTMVSASGSAFTWAGNSRENRLTPFANDPVTDPTGEAIYLRDEDVGRGLGRDARPAAARGRCGPLGRSATRAGVTRYQHAVAGLEQELAVFVAPDDPVKLSRADADQHVERAAAPQRVRLRRVVLGPPRAGERRFVVTELDAATGAMLARNAYNTEFSDRVAFWHATERARARTPATAPSSSAATARSPRRPALFARAARRARSAPGSIRAPRCRSRSRFAPGEIAPRRVRARPGARRRARARRWPRATRRSRRSTRRSRASSAFWDETLGAVQVHTPDDSFDLHGEPLAAVPDARAAGSGRAAARTSRAAPSASATSCRTCWRCCYTRPDLCRAHLLRAASRQFVEGDVQHWWHPPSGPRHADALLRRSAVAAVCRRPPTSRDTGDDGVLDEVVPFLEAPPLEPDEHEAYILPSVSPRDRRRSSSTASAPSIAR